jgi:hypothetical protein
MLLWTLIIGYSPPPTGTLRKPAQARNDAYFKDLLASHDIGEVSFASYENWPQKIQELNPLIIVTFDDHMAQTIHDGKKDALMYVAETPNSVFSRKVDIETKKERNDKVFAEIESMIKRVRDGGEKEEKSLRHFAALSYNDMYKMITQAIIGDDENLRKQAWEILNNNHGHSNFVWMRVQLLGEAWNHCDGKGKEEFICMAMDQHIENGMAYKMENFFEGDQEFHQYMFCYFDGQPMNYIRRVPVGFKKQDKYAYEELLSKFETPKGIPMMLEAGQMRTEKEKWAADLCEKFVAMLKVWKTDPLKPMKELGVTPWYPYTEDDPLVGRELQGFKDFLKKHDKENYDLLFSSPTP